MEEKRFTLRMDGELFEEISEYAIKHRRSTAKEIELAIAKYLLELKESEILAAPGDTNDNNEAMNALKAMSELRKKYRIGER